MSSIVLSLDAFTILMKVKEVLLGGWGKWESHVNGFWGHSVLFQSRGERVK
jgi:hypothetical protein